MRAGPDGDAEGSGIEFGGECSRELRDAWKLDVGKASPPTGLVGYLGGT